jgi:hypothetical protein
MKKLRYLVLVLVCCLAFGSSKSKGNDSVNYFITKEGDSVQVQKFISIDAQYVFYKDMTGKSRTMAQSKISRLQGKLFDGVHFYINLPIMNMKMTRLQDVIATNDNYILTMYGASDGWYAYIWDKQYENKEYKIYMGSKHFQQVAMEKYLLKYFGSCKELIAKMNANIEAGRVCSRGISNYNCASTE